LLEVVSDKGVLTATRDMIMCLSYKLSVSKQVNEFIQRPKSIESDTNLILSDLLLMVG